MTFDKTELSYQNMDVRVRYLPEEHDPTSRMEAMRLAAKTDRPMLGLYFKEERPTRSDEMDDIAARAAAS